MPKRALVIDDEKDIRELVASFLETLHYEVLAAEGGERGLQQAATASPDLVILDIAMPGMDGYEVCRRLHQDPTTRQIPVIMITASSDPALTGKAYGAGARACIPKPFRREAFLAAVRTVVAGAHGEGP